MIDLKEKRRKARLMVGSYAFILFALLILLILPTFGMGPLVELVLFTLVQIAGVSIASERRIFLISALCIAIPWLVVSAISLVTDMNPTVFTTSIGLGVLFLSYTVFLVLHHLLRSKEITADLLLGAAALYLMLGVLWALVYRLIFYFDPNAFGVIEGETRSFLYYSFTTLTTLGYGDISPVSALARTAAILEAIAGVFFTTFLVSRLIGIYLAGVLSEKQR